MYSRQARIVIVCITYNHENYIARAIDSFLMQEVDEPFEIHIHDDASTDNTASIIRAYQEKYPDIIKATIQKKNLYQKDISISRAVAFPSVNAEYVALCEGDDYFTDPKKIQKQKDFLDQNKDFSICFHPVEIKGKNIPENTIFPGGEKFATKPYYTLDDLFESNFIQTNSCMYRWRFNEYERPQDLIPENILPCDHFWHLLHAEKGKIGMLPDVMSVYNKHEGGLWNNALKSLEWYRNCGLKHINFYTAIEKRYRKNAKYVKNKIANNYVLSLFAENNHALLIEFAKEHNDLFCFAIQELTSSSDPTHQQIGLALQKLNDTIKK